MAGGGAGGTGSGGTLLMNCVPSETCKQHIHAIPRLTQLNSVDYVDTFINTPAASGIRSSTDNYFVAYKSQADWMSAIGRVVYRSKICIQ